MKASSTSDIGKIREKNEDKVLADTETGIFLLADGMGGGPGGEIASDLAVSAAYDLLRGRVARAGPASLPELLAEALASAHSALLKRSLREPELAGMGTTLEIVVIKGREACICHVGDSRVYLVREGELGRLTTDDNMASWLMEKEHLPPRDVPPQARHILTQAVGVSDTLIPEIRAVELQEKDILLICSDGLTGMLTDREISEVVLGCRHDLDKAAGELVAAANAMGGADNISVILVEPGPFDVPLPEKTLLPSLCTG